MALNLQQRSNKITLQLLSCLLIAETRLFKPAWQQLPQARSLNCHHPPVSLEGRSRLGGQVLLGIENLSLAPRWAETISTTKALVTQ